MTSTFFLTILSLGLGRGFLHALDPDHILTITALSSRQNVDGSVSRPLRYAVFWSVGHSAMIIAVACLLFLTGLHLPDTVSASAEMVVGVILILTGVSIFWSLRSQRAVADTPSSFSSDTKSAAAPLAIGLIHGLAGSASLLALIPIALLEVGSGLAFVGVFCVGVLVAMLAFSLLYERIQGTLLKFSPDRIVFLQIGVAIAAIGLGTYWLVKG